MKTITIISAVFMFILASCIDLEVNDQSRSEELNDVMIFESHKEYRATISMLGKMTSTELDYFEHEHGFISLRTHLNNAFDALEKIESELEFNAFMERNKDILSFNGDEIVPTIELPTLQAVVNRQGLYITGDFVNRILGNVVLSAHVSEYSRLANVKSINDDLVRSGKASAFSFKGLTNHSTAKTQQACSSNMVQSISVTPGSCKNHRQVIARTEYWVDTYTDGTGTYYQPMVTLYVTGKKKNLFCSWVDYETELDYRNVTFSAWAWLRTGMNQYASITEPRFFEFAIADAHTPFQLNLIWEQAIGDWRFNQYTQSQAFETMHFEGKSRGVDAWVSVICP
jgi:hypothetical protein